MYTKFMAPKVFPPFSYVFLILCLAILPRFSLADVEEPKCKIPTSPFHLILNNLQGCKRGDMVDGLHGFKCYLNHFGYLNHPYCSENQVQAKDNYFDDQLESAIRMYQLNYHLSPTGTLDAETLSMMARPRCGVPDISNGTNWMRAHLHSTVAPSSDLQRWPAHKAHLSFGFLPNTPAKAIGPVVRAFDRWASALEYFTFSRATDPTNVDIRIGFFSGDHGDDSPFEAPAVAQAFPPSDGRLHYNADVSWSAGPVPGAIDYETVALHEIGHLLGLAHSSVPDSIMWPVMGAGMTKDLNADDIQGIKDLYNVN